MKADAILGFASGSLNLLALVAALVFLRRWRATRDPLFVFSAVAAAAVVASWAAAALWPRLADLDAFCYGIRLPALLAVVLVIVDENWRGRRR